MRFNISGRKVGFYHLGEKLVCKSKLIGQGSQKELRDFLLEQRFYMPTTAEFFSYLDLAFQNIDGANFVDILKIFKEKQLCLWNEVMRARNPDCIETERKFKSGYIVLTCTESEYFPEVPSPLGISTILPNPLYSAGTFVINDRDGKISRDRKDLTNLLNEKDPRLGWVKSGLENWKDMSISDLLNHPYFITQVGGEQMLDTAERVLKACHENFAFMGYPGSGDVQAKGLTAVFLGSNHRNWLYLNGAINSVSNRCHSLALYPTKRQIETFLNPQK